MAYPASNPGSGPPTLADAIRSSSGAPARIRALLKRCDRSLIDRFEQFLVESEQIIPAVADAICKGQIDRIGPLVDRSQHLAETMLGNQVDQTKSLARTARELGAVAASAFGAGFGGSVWALISETQAEDFRQRWKEKYHDLFPRNRDRSAFFITRAGPGVVHL